MEEPVDNRSSGVTPLSHTRLLILMALVAAVGTVIALTFFSSRAGIGFAIGGVLSLVNYLWMKRSLRMAFGETEDGVGQSFAGSGYLMRYIAFASVIGAIYLLDWHLLVPVILGLSSFAFAVVIEGFIRIFRSVSNRKGI